MAAIVPALAGETPVVSRYWVLKPAVYVVAEAGVETV